MPQFDPESIKPLQEEIEKKSAQNPGGESREDMQARIAKEHAEKLKDSIKGKQLSHVPEEELSDDMTMTYAPDPPSRPMTGQQGGEAVVYPFTGKLGKILKDCAYTGEPIFVFRAKDIFSTMVLAKYLEIVESYGPSDHEFQRTLVESLEMFKAWQAENTDKVRYPD